MKPKVLDSFENATATHCVDIFQRGDGSFGFEEFRRDPEDRGLWQCLNKFGQGVFATGQAAVDAAKESVPWLNTTAVWRW
ncbi:MAG: hypothetical protein V4625_11915 [Pseudomonadota bacterium]